jgi:hypothetical protein
MRIIPLSSMAALALAAGVVSQTNASIVPAQKGNACSAVWDTGTAPATAATNPKKPWTLSCSDGDPICDRDGAQNGSCTLEINGCAFTTEVQACTLEPLTLLKFNGVVKNKLIGFVATPTGGGVAVCGVPGRITLPLKGKKKNKPSAKLLLLANFKTASGKGKNALKVQCVTTPTTRVCADRDPATLPKQITLTVPKEGSDLDTGVSGNSHNFPVINGSSLKYCLSECDGTSDTACVTTGTTGPDSLNGETFGAPLPLFTIGAPVCVVNRYQDATLTGTFDLASGVASGDVNLFADTYLRLGFNSEVCPRCIVPNKAVADVVIGDQGKCSVTSTTPNAPCITNGLGNVFQNGATTIYTLSSSCTPGGSFTRLDIKLPLTTGTQTSLPGPLPCASVGQPKANDCGGGNGACGTTCEGNACVTKNSAGQCLDAKGGIAQNCCVGNTSLPCFPTEGGGSISRTGTPINPNGTFAATFCIPPTNDPTINLVSGLPGPGALLLPVVREVIPAP